MIDLMRHWNAGIKNTVLGHRHHIKVEERQMAPSFCLGHKEQKKEVYHVKL